ncbi:MAG TPA: histidine kinase [Solirubrobacter sp.]|nr:histidine kinase [Solirubrobacter sp.]
MTRRQIGISVAAAAMAAVAFAVTASADFLERPGWLALQKADVILGPVLVGLYWRHRRPRSQFALLLIAAGFLMVPYILQSSSEPAAYAFGVAWESVIYMVTLTLILAFPSGRLDRASRLLLAAGALFVALPGVLVVALTPRLVAIGSISGCAGACPENGLLLTAAPGAAATLLDLGRLGIVAVATATIGVLVARLRAAKPARRRTLVIGIPIAMVFLVTQVAFQTTVLLAEDRGEFHTVAQWAIAVARSTLWYGFLAALIGAQLYAARVLRRSVEESLRRPSFADLERMLRDSVGDRSLRLLFWRTGTRSWSDAYGAAVREPNPSPAQEVTDVDFDAAPAIAIVHDREQAEDPELIHAAGAAALLARDHAEREAAWEDSRRVLRESRSRIASARDDERRALERDLHDSVQQQLAALVLRLALVREMIDPRSPANEKIEGLEVDLQETLSELRRLAHGIYPTSLAELGLIGALTAAATRSPTKVTIHADAIGRFPPEIESAVYYCCLEALQNAAKHAGADPRVAIRLSVVGGQLHFEVRDEGVGFDPATPHAGVGLRNIHDRLEAVNGRIEIVSAPGRGTVVTGAVPVG